MSKKRSSLPKCATGILHMNPRGFGFLIPDDRDLFPEDIFIPRHATKGAVDGDHVEVALNPQNFAAKGPEGWIKKILQRGRSHVAGVICYVGKKSQVYAYVPLLGEGQSMKIIPAEERVLQLGDRIIIQVLDWGGRQRESLGQMSAYIGHISDPSCDTTAAIEEFELNSDFPDSALEEAKAYGSQVTQKEIKNREDLRELECVTIDPDRAKDFDDALSLTIDKKGLFHLGVHIADVSHYVKAGTSLDQEAQLRCNSVYFPDCVIPMLPHELSSHLCSLKPNVNRLAVSVLMRINQEGNLEDYRICKSVIRSKKRFTYKEAKQVIDGEQKSPFSPLLNNMVTLCLLLKKKKAERGSIEFALPDLSIELNEEGLIQKIESVEYDISHQVVEEFMLLANEIVATHLSKNGKPLTYRIHEEPSPENLRDFALSASMMGFPLPASPSAFELQNLFENAIKTPFGRFLATAFIRSMKLASYSTENIGHYGLGLDYYTHFTSPIRRYIDLLVHRVLFDERDGNDLDALALRCSEKERLSSRAESSVLLLKKLRYLAHEVEQGHDTYQVTVVAVKNFGIFFEIQELLYEGFLPLVDQGFAIGDHITVQLETIDLVTRRSEWKYLERIKKKK